MSTESTNKNNNTPEDLKMLSFNGLHKNPKLQLPKLLCEYQDLVSQLLYSIQPQHPDQPM